MITADYHTHSAFSTDSEADIEKMVLSAIKKGMKKICITDHFDKDYPSDNDEISFDGENKTKDFEFEPKKYFGKVYEMRRRYKNDIEVLCGVELGFRNEPEKKEGIKDFYNTLLDNYDFDFIIGSTHVLENIDIYYEDYWKDKSIYDAISSYFKSIIQNAAYYNEFMVYGHLDYIVRYIPDKIKQYNYTDYIDFIDDALKAIIENGKGIELNTSGYKYGLGLPHPKPEIIKRYKELGGEVITIGSDAHKPEHIAYDFNLAEEVLLKAGFKYYTVFKNRRPEFIKIG